MHTSCYNDIIRQQHYYNRKKKKKKVKDLPIETISEEVKEEKVYKKVKTPAQLAFDKAQEKRVRHGSLISIILIVYVTTAS